MQRAIIDRCMELLAFVGLEDKANMYATSLPHGGTAGAVSAVALASDPVLLLLDEPLTGMNAEETAAMIDIIKALNKERARRRSWWSTTCGRAWPLRAHRGSELRAEAG